MVFSQLRICRPPPPSVWSGFYGSCAMCWNERKINFHIFQIFIFQVIVKFHRKLEWWRHKNSQKMTITRKIKIGKTLNLIFFLFSRFRIFHVNLNPFNFFFWNFFFSEKIFEYFWRKKNSEFFFFFFFPTKMHPGSRIFFRIGGL